MRSTLVQSQPPPADMSASESDIEEGAGDEHIHFFPLLPSSFSQRLTLANWHPILLPTSAGRLLLTRDTAFPGQRCVELQCDAGRVDGVGMVYPADDEYIGTALPVVNLHIKNVQSPHSAAAVPGASCGVVGLLADWLLLRLAVCVMLLGQVGRYMSFAVDVEDVTGRQRTFSASNHQTVARMGEDSASLPLKLSDEWNKVPSTLTTLQHQYPSIVVCRIAHRPCLFPAAAVCCSLRTVLLTLAARTEPCRSHAESVRCRV